MYLFIGLKVSVYILMIYKLSKKSVAHILTQHKEMQPWKFSGKNRNPIFWIFFSFLGLMVYEVDL